MATYGCRMVLPVDDAARLAYQKGMSTLKQSRKLLGELGDGGFTTLLRPREKRGSAENPIPKMFPATVSEERYLELVDQLCDDVNGLSISDEREVGHGLSDFTLVRGEQQLPINIKNAGTRFERSAELVGLEPDDCIPIPAYKAHEPVR